MSRRMPDWAWEQDAGSATNKAVLLALANRHNGRTGQCNPRVATIAGDGNPSAPPVKRAPQQLARNVEVVEGEHTGAMVAEASLFPHGVHDDIVDAMATGFNELEGHLGPTTATKAKHKPGRFTPSSQDSFAACTVAALPAPWSHPWRSAPWCLSMPSSPVPAQPQPCRPISAARGLTSSMTRRRFSQRF